MPEKRIEDYAIVVGINHYRDLNPLDGAKDDAKSFARWLRSAKGGNLPSENVKTFYSKAGATVPRLETLVDWFIDLIRAKSPDLDERIGRRLYIYLAGHGIGPGIDDAGLLTPSTSALAVKYLAGRTYADYFREAALFDEVVLMMDCCRDHDWELPEAFFPLKRQVDAGAAHVVKSLYVYATGFGRKAREKPFDGKVAGVFTHALLEGLSGQAANQEGQVTGESLKDYVKRRVAALRAAGTDQQPHVLLPDDFVLCEGFDPPTVTVTVELAAPAEEFSVSYGKDMTPVDAVPRELDGGRWEIDLIPGKIYVFQVKENGTLVPRTAKVIDEEDSHVKL
ncbi:MAG: caspase family protein [Anaerolineae bacterium]|nr:caspase family protein [Anaerolineae bacterium]